MKRVISLWLPRFAIDRLTRGPGGARQGPLALTLEQGGRRTLFAVDAAAERGWLRPGMPLADARALMPALNTLPARPRDDAAALTRLARWCGRWSPWTAADLSVEPIGIGGGGGLWLDATGCAHLFGGEKAMLEDITVRLNALGFSARAGMADTPGCAWAVARYAAEASAWTVVPEEDQHTALESLPVAALRLPAGDVAMLHGLGLKCVRDLMRLPRAPIARRFGGHITEQLDAALGLRAEPISPLDVETVHAAFRTFAEPVGRLDDIASTLDALLAELCTGLEHAAQGARRLALTLYRPDGTLTCLRIGTARPSRETAHLARLFAEKLGAIEAEFGIEAMTLRAEATDRLTPGQGTLGDAGRADATDEIAHLVDRLGTRLGLANVRRAVRQPSHLPERAAALAPVRTPETWRWKDTPDDTDSLPRPVRLFRPPEPVEAVAATGEAPVLFRWRHVEHRVVRTEGPERIAPEWWRAGPAESAAPRDYYRLEDIEGRRFWLYRETGPRTVRWYLHGLFG
jgi:protein ImuB